MTKIATKQFGDNSKSYPAEMRTQLWPLCCGMSIISGFKDAHTKTEEQILKQIKECVDEYTPDHQVYAGEVIKPKLIWLTLNAGQMGSAKIMGTIKKAGFVQLAVAKPRGSDQGIFILDKSNSFKLV